MSATTILSQPETAQECTHKQCSKCKESYPLEGFYNDKSSRDGKKTWCKECVKDSLNADKGRVQGYLEPGLHKLTVAYAKHNDLSESAFTRMVFKMFFQQMSEGERHRLLGLFE